MSNSSMPDWAAIARTVADGLDIQHGERVSVFLTDVSAMSAVVAFVTESYRRGAVPQVLLTDERFDAVAVSYADDETLSSPLPLEAAAIQWCDVHVSFRAMMPPTPGIDPARAALLRHGRGVVSTMRWQQTRWALVRLLTPAWADAFELDAENLLQEWTGSFAADWTDARQRMDTLCRTLETTDAVVMSDADTDLRLPTTARRWVPFSGQANWPDGEIATAPLEDQVEGHITFPGTTVYGGVVIRDLTLEIEGGLVTRTRATEGRDFVEHILDTDAGARRVGELGIGTNAALITPTHDLLIDEKILGTAHIALGRAYPECGGVNSSALHWDIVKDLRGPAANLRAGQLHLIADGGVGPALQSAAVGASVPDRSHTRPGHHDRGLP